MGDDSKRGPGGREGPKDGSAVGSSGSSDGPGAELSTPSTDRPHLFDKVFKMARAAPDDDKPLVVGIPFAGSLGIRIVDGGPGRAVLSAPYDARMIGDTASGVLHGGVVTTLLDTCAGFAAGSSPTRTSAVATLDLRIDYLRPATPGQPILAEATLYRETSQIDFVRAVAHQGDPEDPVATAVATFMAERRSRNIFTAPSDPPEAGVQGDAGDPGGDA